VKRFHLHKTIFFALLVYWTHAATARTNAVSSVAKAALNAALTAAVPY
jgi:hypothetical protein